MKSSPRLQINLVRTSFTVNIHSWTVKGQLSKGKSSTIRHNLIHKQLAELSILCNESNLEQLTISS